MKKLLIALAAVLVLAACGSKKTPATELMDKMQAMSEFALKFQENPSLASPEDIQKAEKMFQDVQDFVKENKDYVLTDADRKAVKDFAQEMAKKMGEEIGADDLADIDQWKTLGDMAKDMDF